MRHDAIIIGGCRGTIPDHIRHAAAPLRARAIPERSVAPRLPGLERYELAS